MKKTLLGKTFCTLRIKHVSEYLYDWKLYEGGRSFCIYCEREMKTIIWTGYKYEGGYLLKEKRFKSDYRKGSTLPKTNTKTPMPEAKKPKAEV